MRALRVIMAVLAACGPSKEQRSTEARAYAAMLDHRIEVIRVAHACDEQIAEMTAATGAIPEASVLNLAEAERLTAKARAAVDRAQACRALMPSVDEMRAKAVALSDAWMDACVECASGAACVAAERELRTLVTGFTMGDPQTAQRVAIDAMKARPVCSREPVSPAKTL